MLDFKTKCMVHSTEAILMVVRREREILDYLIDRTEREIYVDETLTALACIKLIKKCLSCRFKDKLTNPVAIK